MMIFDGLTRSSSLRELRAVAQPPQFSPSVLDSLYRLPSIFLSLPLARLGATPNGITVAWIAIGLAGAVALVSDSWAVRVGGVLLLQLSYLLDFVDGEVARLRRQTSDVGNFLDLVGHGLIKSSLPLATAWAAARGGHEAPWMLAGAVAVVTITVGDSLRFYAAVTAGDPASGDLARVGRATSAWSRSRSWRRIRRLATGLFNLSFESPGLYGLVLVGAVLDRLDVVVLYWAVGGTLWFARRAVHYCLRLRHPDAANGDVASQPVAAGGTTCR